MSTDHNTRTSSDACWKKLPTMVCLQHLLLLAPLRHRLLCCLRSTWATRENVALVSSLWPRAWVCLGPATWVTFLTSSQLLQAQAAKMVSKCTSPVQFWRTQSQEEPRKHPGWTGGGLICDGSVFSGKRQPFPSSVAMQFHSFPPSLLQNYFWSSTRCFFVFFFFLTWNNGRGSISLMFSWLNGLV